MALASEGVTAGLPWGPAGHEDGDVFRARGGMARLARVSVFARDDGGRRGGHQKWYRVL